MPPSSDCPFINVPLTNLTLVTADNVSTLTWKFNHGGYEWRTRLKTENYTLYKYPVPLSFTTSPDMPIEKNNHYNVSITSDDGLTKNVTTVTLSLQISDNVLKHVPYIYCKIFRHPHGTTIEYDTPSVFLEFESTPTTVSSIHQEPTQSQETLLKAPTTASSIHQEPTKLQGTRSKAHTNNTLFTLLDYTTSNSGSKLRCSLVFILVWSALHEVLFMSFT